MFLRKAKSRTPPILPSRIASRSAPGACSPSNPAHTSAPVPSAVTDSEPRGSEESRSRRRRSRPPPPAIAPERDLPERTAARYAWRFLEDDAADLVGVRNDRRDAPLAPRAGDVSAERVDDVVHPLLDVEHCEGPRSEEQFDPDLEPIAFAVADTASGL